MLFSLSEFESSIIDDATGDDSNESKFNKTIKDFEFPIIHETIKQDHLIYNEINKKIILHHIHNDIVDSYKSKLMLKASDDYMQHTIINKPINNALKRFNAYVIYDICDELQEIGYITTPINLIDDTYYINIQAPYHKINARHPINETVIEIEEPHINVNNEAEVEVGISNRCCVCMEAVKNTLFQPCKHVATCSACSAQVSDCPICRIAITDRIQIFY